MPYTKNIHNLFQDPHNPGFRSVKVQTETFLKNDSWDFKNYSYLGFLRIPSKPGKQNWIVPFFWVFIIHNCKKTVCFCNFNIQVRKLSIFVLECTFWGQIYAFINQKYLVFRVNGGSLELFYSLLGDVINQKRIGQIVINYHSQALSIHSLASKIFKNYY